jgi:hypothetical protein
VALPAARTAIHGRHGRSDIVSGAFAADFLFLFLVLVLVANAT